MLEREKANQRPMLTLVALSLFAMVGGNMLTPTLYLYAIELGASLALIGLIASSASAARFISRIPMGLLSDRFGRRPLIRLGTLGVVCSLLLLYLAHTPFEILVAYVISTLAFTSIFTIGLTMASEINSSRRATGVSLFALSSSSAMFIAPGICSLLLLTMRIRETYLVALLIALGGVLCSTQVAASPGLRRSLDIKGSLSSVLKDENVRFVAILEAFFALGFNSIFIFLPLYLSRGFQLTSAEVSFLVATYSLAMMAIRIPLPRILHRIDEVSMIGLGLLEYATALMAIPFGYTLIHFSILLFAAGMAHGIIFPSMALIVSRSSGLDLGLANSVYLGVGDVVTIVAPPIAVSFVEVFGYNPLYWTVSIGMLLGAAYVMVKRRRRSAQIGTALPPSDRIIGVITGGESLWHTRFASLATSTLLRIRGRLS